MSIRFTWEQQLTGRNLLEHYRSFRHDAHAWELMLSARHIGELSPVFIDDSPPAFRSGASWALFQNKDGWHYISPSDTHACRRLVVWSPTTKMAQLCVTQRDGKTDPLGHLTFPFFSAFFAQHRGILLHGAAVKMGNEAWVFAGPSGSGKSHWTRECMQAGAMALGEDRIVLRSVDDRVWAFGTPWHWSGQLFAADGAPVTRVFFLRQAADNECLPLEPARAAATLLRSAILPIYDSTLMANMLETADVFSRQVRAFRIGYSNGNSGVMQLLAIQ